MPPTLRQSVRVQKLNLSSKKINCSNCLHWFIPSCSKLVVNIILQNTLKQSTYQCCQSILNEIIYLFNSFHYNSHSSTKLGIILVRMFPFLKNPLSGLAAHAKNISYKP